MNALEKKERKIQNLIDLGNLVAKYRHKGYSVEDTLAILNINRRKYFSSYKAAGYKLEGNTHLVNRYGGIELPKLNPLQPNPINY
jgi:hypothetical protein